MIQIRARGYIFRVSMFYGARWYSLRSWKDHPGIRKLGKWDRGFSIGPIMFVMEGWGNKNLDPSFQAMENYAKADVIATEAIFKNTGGS